MNQSTIFGDLRHFLGDIGEYDNDKLLKFSRSHSQIRLITA